MPADTQHFFGGGGQTDVQPLTLALVLVFCVLLLCIPRKYAFVPLLAATLLIAIQQQIVVGGIHVTMSRLLLVVGWIRLAMVKTQKGRKLVSPWTRLDTVFVAYCISNVVTYVLLWAGDSGALINRLGFLFNAWGMYFFIRFFVRDSADLIRATKALVWIFAIVAVGMTGEAATGKNVFSRFGGVPELSTVRGGKIRAQGPFIHPLTAGTIGVTVVPLSIGVWWTDKRNKRNKRLAILGGAVALAMALSSRSSTAVLAIAAALLGLMLWRWRRHLPVIRWAIVIVLVALHFVMKAPVWALLARIDLTGSSSGFHRYLLVDQFIRRFGEWWLIGVRTTEDWGWDMWDTINSYVTAGTGGGLINFILFISLFVTGFRLVGRRVRTVYPSDPALARLVWSGGVLLFAHAVAFFGISYFDQTQFVWYASLAIVSTALTLRPAPPPEPACVSRTGSGREIYVPAIRA